MKNIIWKDINDNFIITYFIDQNVNSEEQKNLMIANGSAAGLTFYALDYTQEQLDELMQWSNLNSAKHSKIAQLKSNRDIANINPMLYHQAKEILFDDEEEEFTTTENDVNFRFKLNPTGYSQTESTAICFGVILSSIYYPDFFARYSCDIIEGESTRKGYVKIDRDLALKIINFGSNRIIKNTSHCNKIEKIINDINIIEDEVTYDDALELINSVDITFPDQDSDYSPPELVTIQSMVNDIVSQIIDSAPENLNTLNEIAAALGDDPNLATTLTNLIATKATAAQGAKADSAVQPADLANYTTSSALTTALESKVSKNSSITGATKTKVTYDSKGLVTEGDDATTADIADSADKRYCTDAEKTKLSGIAIGATVNTTVKEGTNSRVGSFPYFSSATVSSGVAVFHLTADGNSNGAAIFPNGKIDSSINAFVSDANASYQMSYAFSNSNKTLTITVNKFTTANIISGVLGQAAANGAVVNLQIWGY